AGAGWIFNPVGAGGAGEARLSTMANKFSLQFLNLPIDIEGLSFFSESNYTPIRAGKSGKTTKAPFAPGKNFPPVL
ncbi:MAG: hypothetical protein ACOY81_12465, partial [Bacillota bacterium]